MGRQSRILTVDTMEFLSWIVCWTSGRLPFCAAISNMRLSLSGCSPFRLSASSHVIFWKEYPLLFRMVSSRASSAVFIKIIIYLDCVFSSLSGRNRFHVEDDIHGFPDVVRDTGRHGRGDAQGAVDAAEVVEGVVEVDACLVVGSLF